MGQRSTLITPEVETSLKAVFERMTNAIEIKAVLDAEKASQEMLGILEHISDMTDKISFFQVSVDQIEARDKAHLPITSFYKDGSYVGISFHGVPGGAEMNSFVTAIILSGGAKKPDDKDLLAKAAKIEQKTVIDVLVSLSCHHCANQVMNCEKIAFLSPNVEMAMYDARLYPDLVEKFKLERIPLTVINDSEQIMGVKEPVDIIAKI